VYDEDDLLPLSAVQHLVFCERQCALIHLEGLWEENRLTVQGKRLHDSVHEARDESRGDTLLARGVRIRSLRLGLAGQADVVEFHRVKDVEEQGSPSGVSQGIILSGRAGRWTPFPVEYKRGRPKANHCDEVQLCAQALCLEEMLDVTVPAGALYYGRTRRRCAVSFDEALRRQTEEAARRLRALIEGGVTSAPVFAARCKQCSLLSDCMPEVAGGRSATRYLWNALRRSESAD